MDFSETTHYNVLAIFLSTKKQVPRYKVTKIYTVEEKPKYHITFFCEKNESIIYRVLPNSPENVFLRLSLF